MKREKLLRRYEKAKDEYRTANRAFMRAQGAAISAMTVEAWKAADPAWEPVKRCKRKRARLSALLEYSKP